MASAEIPLHARLSARHWPVTGVAVALAAGGAVLVGSWAGWPATARAVGYVHPAWIALIVLLAPLAVGGYAIAYWALSRLEHAPDPGWPAILRVVVCSPARPAIR